MQSRERKHPGQFPRLLDAEWHRKAQLSSSQHDASLSRSGRRRQQARELQASLVGSLEHPVLEMSVDVLADDRILRHWSELDGSTTYGPETIGVESSFPTIRATLEASATTSEWRSSIAWSRRHPSITAHSC